MGLTITQIIIFYVGMIVCMCLGWHLWHAKNADFMNAFSGSCAFFGCGLCLVIFTCGLISTLIL